LTLSWIFMLSRAAASGVTVCTDRALFNVVAAAKIPARSGNG
jgi:hypothetical protein